MPEMKIILFLEGELFVKVRYMLRAWHYFFQKRKQGIEKKEKIKETNFKDQKMLLKRERERERE